MKSLYRIVYALFSKAVLNLIDEWDAINIKMKR